MKKVWGKDLYLIAAGPELTKLGRSQHPEKRLQEFSRHMPFAECVLWAVFPNAGCLEAQLHKELAILHEKRGEWYRCSVETVARTVVSRLAVLDAPGGGDDP
jgi:Meiotically up-regulated gene 113